MVEGDGRVRVQSIKEAVDSLGLGEEGGRGRRRGRKGGRSCGGGARLCCLGFLGFGHGGGDWFAAVVVVRCGRVAGREGGKGEEERREGWGGFFLLDFGLPHAAFLEDVSLLVLLSFCCCGCCGYEGNVSE